MISEKSWKIKISQKIEQKDNMKEERRKPEDQSCSLWTYQMLGLIRIPERREKRGGNFPNVHLHPQHTRGHTVRYVLTVQGLRERGGQEQTEHGMSQ